MRKKGILKPSIKQSMVRMIFLYVLVPLFVMLAVLCFLLYRTSYESTEEAFQMMFSQNVTRIDDAILQSNYASSAMIVYSESNEFLKNYYKAESEYETDKIVAQIENMLSNYNITMLGSFQGELILVMNDGYVINSAKHRRQETGLEVLSWYRKMEKNGQYPYWDNDMNDLFDYDPVHSYVVFGRALVRYQTSPLGYALVRIPEETLFRFREDSGFQKGVMAMFSEDGRLLACSEGTISEEEVKELYARWQEDGYREGHYGKYYLMASDLIYSRNVVIYAGNVHEMFAHSERILIYVLAFMIVISLILTGVVMSVSQYITRPILSLSERVQKIGENQPELLKLEDNYFQETRMLENRMFEAQKRIEHLLEEVRTETEMKEKARFETLKAQINPHFLFNTLNAIRWKAELQGDKEVADALSALGLLLGETYQNDNETECISEALDVLDAYVKIMQIRFGEKIQFFFSVPEQLGSYQIPRFCLQPLVENSFIHGLSHTECGIIALRGERVGEDIVLTLVDNGSGLQGKIPDLKEEKSSNKRGITGIGISNIHQRIQAMYGNGYGLSIDTNVEIGFKISLRIPAIKEDDTDEGADRRG